MKGPFLFHNTALGIGLGRLSVPLHDIELLDDDAVAISKHLQDLSGLAVLAARPDECSRALWLGNYNAGFPP